MADRIDRRRRKLLARLGLATAGAWIAPAMAGLDTARASDGSGGGSGGRSRPSSPAPRRAPPRASGPPPELVLLLPAGAGATAALTGAGYPVLAESELAGSQLYRLGLPPGQDAAQALAGLSLLFPEGIGDRNSLYTTDDFLCDGGCAAHAMIGWPGLPGNPAPRIGMIDTGINTGHEALAGQKLFVRQADLAGRAAAGRQHGTAVAALLIGRADSRTPGLLPLAELHAVEAFHRHGGREAADAFSLAGAVDHLIAAEVSVINMSFSGPENAVLRALAMRAHTAGIGLVAAAGNDGPGAPPSYPAAWPEVIAVTAVDAGQQAWRQANRGPYVDLAAPGVNLWTAASVSGGRLRSGTSYAAPFVTAALAAERARAPERSLAEHEAGLIACARDLGDAGFDETYGHGILSLAGQCSGQAGAKNLPLFIISGE